jgi:hypothetical protein
MAQEGLQLTEMFKVMMHQDYLVDMAACWWSKVIRFDASPLIREMRTCNFNARARSHAAIKAKSAFHSVSTFDIATLLFSRPFSFRT